jgi:hypothetical protein
MVKQITIKELNFLINEVYNKKDNSNRKIPMLVYGTFGIGKSQVIRGTAKEIAKKRNREFVDWNRLTKEEKYNVFENPEKYFVLMDIRLSEYDVGDFKLPDFSKDKDTFEWKINLWEKFLTKENSDGILFFDEINLASPSVISSVYKIIYDRVINDSKINEEWLIIGAGNLSNDKAYTHDLAPPVRDRGLEVELTIPNSEDWVDWAIENKIDSRIIGFISFKPSALHNVDFEDKQKFTSPRGWERINTLIKDVEDLKIIDLLTSTAISEGIAKEFLAFCKIKKDIDLENVIKNPKKIKEITEISTKYFIVSALVDKYQEKKIKFDTIKEFTEILDEINNAEFVTLLWRLCFKHNKSQFKKDFVNSKISPKLKEKYGYYLGD